MVESLRGRAEKGARGENHNCKTMVTLKMMMDGDVDAVKAGTSEFTTTLHKAAYSGYYGTTKLLLDANADVNEPLEGLDGATPLHCAAYGGHVEIARALLDARARVDVEDSNGITPLDIALSRRNTDLANLLIQAGARVRLTSPTSENPEDRIFDLAIEGNADELRALLAGGGGADPNRSKELAEIGRVTALHLAAELGREEVVAALLDAGADADPRTAEDTTPLHQAAMNGHREVVEMLLGAGADVNARDVRGATPLGFALHRNKMDVAEVISEAGGRVDGLGGSNDRCCGCVCS
jgi:ankyrin repeat protein